MLPGFNPSFEPYDSDKFLNYCFNFLIFKKGEIVVFITGLLYR